MKKYFLTTFALFFFNFAKNTEKILPIEIESNSKIVVNEEKQNHVFKDTSIRLIRRIGIHSATWYNAHGARTASGEKFHKDSLTAAYNFSKMHTYLKVTNVNTNESIVVRVTDRMGIKSKNHIDLSRCAFDSIANLGSGRIKVIVEEIIQ